MAAVLIRTPSRAPTAFQAVPAALPVDHPKLVGPGRIELPKLPGLSRQGVPFPYKATVPQLVAPGGYDPAVARLRDGRPAIERWGVEAGDGIEPS